MLVPGILTVWRSGQWISDKSAHKFSQTLTSQQDKSSLYPQVIESAEDDEMIVNQRRMAGGEGEAMTAFVICSGLNSYRATVVTVIDRSRIPMHSPAAARCFYWYWSPSLLQQLDWFVRGEISSIFHGGDIEPWTHWAVCSSVRWSRTLPPSPPTLWKQPVLSVAMTMWACAIGGSEQSFNRMAVFESGASSRESGIDYCCINAAAALRMLFIVIESSSGGALSFREDECAVA